MKHSEVAVATDLDAAKILQLGVGARDFPALAISAQLAFVLEAAVANVLLKKRAIELIAPCRKNNKRKRYYDGRKMRRYKLRWIVE